MIDLGGHSGCQIILMEGNRGNFVRKISSDTAYNKRLELQFRKQAGFSNAKIKSPGVLNSGYTDNGLFFFDMEYIQGVTLAEYIKRIEIGKIRNLAERIAEGVIPEVCENVGSILSVNEIFRSKTEKLKAQLSGKGWTIIEEALEKLECHDWGMMSPSPCHGDLTMENIIVRNECMYLIDFLDSFYDSWILDIGTLLQDIQTLWSYRFMKNMDMNTILRLVVFRDLLLDRVEQKKPGCVIEIYYALLLKLVRIFPYTNDEPTFGFLLEKTKTVMNIISEKEEHL